jgi:hypothetical protein
MRKTADVTGSKAITVFLQSISGASAINPLIGFYEIHGRKREVLFIYFVPDTTRDQHQLTNMLGEYLPGGVLQPVNVLLVNIHEV